MRSREEWRGCGGGTSEENSKDGGMGDEEHGEVATLCTEMVAVERT